MTISILHHVFSLFLIHLVKKCKVLKNWSSPFPKSVDNKPFDPQTDKQ